VIETPHPIPETSRGSRRSLQSAGEPDLAIAPVDVGPASHRDPGLLDGLLSAEEDTLCLVLDGAVDSRLAATLDQMLESVGATDVRHIVLELATVTFMDTTGLRFLFDLRRLAAERGGTVRLADPSPAVLELVELSGATDLFGVHPAPPADATDTTEDTQGWAAARPA
jgi:stage II sporulation protein AA (anti-sigma F factor antagonist)